MTNYAKSVNFAVKDTLSSGDPNKIVSGAEIDTEFNNIASSSTTKIDKVSAAETSNVASFTGTGGIKDSGRPESALIPSGGIIMWSGLISSIPSGWNLCDGTNGTPDLRNRFVVGAGDQYDRNDTGGADSVTLTENEIPSHDHSMNSAGSHNHGGSTNDQPITGSFFTRKVSDDNIFEQVSGVFSEVGQQPIDRQEFAEKSNVFGSIAGVSIDATHSHGIPSGGDHTHTINNTGGDGSHENRPPYLALAYIMKL